MKHLMTRSAVIEFKPKEDGGLMRAALSSDAPIKMRGMTEVLVHSEDAIDLSRAANGRGLPITVGHSEMDPLSPDLPVGRVINLSIDDDGKMRGDLDFDVDERSKEVAGKVSRGMAGLSVTYDPGPGRKRADGVIERRQWQPRALSVVSVEADVNAGVGRSLETEEGASTVSEPETEVTQMRSLIEEVQEQTSAGYQAGMQAATQRLSEIDSDVASLTRAAPGLASQIETLASRAREDVNITPEEFRSMAIKLMGMGAQPLAGEPEPPTSLAFAAPTDRRRSIVVAGEDVRSRAYQGLELAILERTVPGVVEEDAMKGNQYRGWSMLDVCREILEVHGVDTRGKNSEQIAKAAISMRAISPGTAQYVTTDFPALTENIGFKAAFEGFQRAPRTWDMWCDTGSTPDFKQFTIPRLSHTSKLPVVAENAAYTNLTRTDAKESATATKKGGLISYSWESVVNNDVNSFADQMQSCGEAAQATIDRDVYAQLEANPGAGPVQGPVMGDGNQLYSAAHSNLSTVALSLAGIVDVRVKMGRQTGDNGEEIEPRLSYVVVPLELEDEARNLSVSEYLVDEGGAAQRANTVRNTFEVVSTSKIGTTDTNDWYGMARRGQTCRVFFLNGVQAPTLERESGWDTDAMHYKVRVVYIPVFRDWRGTVLSKVA